MLGSVKMCKFEQDGGKTASKLSKERKRGLGRVNIRTESEISPESFK